MAEHDDSDIDRVLRAAGRRAQPPPDVKQSIYEAVHAEWLATLGKPAPRRPARHVWLAAAASILVAAVILFFARDQLFRNDVVVASIGRSIGVVEIQEVESGPWNPLVDDRPLHAGERIQTGPNGRIAIRLPDGVSVRLDRSTNIGLLGTDRIDLKAGAVYVDSGTTEPKPGRLIVSTATGTIRHVGTQYEARLLEDGLTRVRVREGRVDVTPGEGASSRTVETGDQVLMSSGAVQSSGRIEPDSDEWDWASSTAPEFSIDGTLLHEFLTWAARETGLRLVFATPESAEEARRAVLSGSIAGLTPDEALAAVLPTTRLRSTEREGRLVIELAGR